MPKAVISNRIYLDNPGEEVTKKITKELTYKYTKFGGTKTAANVETIRNYKILPKGIISIPQCREDLIPEGYEVVDKRIIEEVPFPEPKFPLREAQIPVYEEANGTCFINALPGWGSLCLAL